MSRVCVKNLPKHVAEDRIRDFFSQKGEVTDAKLMRTKDGKSRQFAFVGFRSEKEAEEAMKFFNGSFMDTCRITCEIARKVGDPEIPRPWSRHSLKKQEKFKEEKREAVSPEISRLTDVKKKNNTENNDPQFHEFLQVMQPRTKSKLWSNDLLAVPSLDKEKGSFKKVQVKGEDKKGTPSKPAMLDEASEELEGISDSEATERKRSMECDKVVSDIDYFRSKVIKDWSDTEMDDDDANEDTPYVQKVHSKVKFEMPEKDVEEIVQIGSTEQHDDMADLDESTSSLKDDEVLETGRLFVRNLPYTATEDDLEAYFSKFGSVSQVHLVVDKDTKRSKGFAYVLYALPESAARALEELDKSIFQGRLLHIMPAKQKNLPTKEGVIGSANHPNTFKRQREEERKKSEVAGDTRAWNSLFMRSDTVVENIAREYGVSKSELLDREADDVAVRIALGETQVVAKTKKALVNAGVNITSLEDFANRKNEGVKRSNHVILVKNLPYASSESELANMFGKFGSIDKVILPSTKALGLVVFLEPAEARAAFKGLAYKRYKDTPLYLEWAPHDIFSENSLSIPDASEISVVEEYDNKRVLLEKHVEATADDDIDTDRVERRTLFVKNLNFRTSDESLQKHFSEHMKEGKILSVRVNKHLKNGKKVSMGFGFIEFDSVDTATHVCRDLQGTVLDGHALILQLSHVKNSERVREKVDKDQSSTKLIVRNVAFEATEKELRQLFSPFGQIKRLRLPTRFGKHRGFAFVEYVTKQETKNALEALSNTHLYGRHLVLERAKEGESLEELRARTAAQFTNESNGFQTSSKLSRKRKQLDGIDQV